MVCGGELDPACGGFILIPYPTPRLAEFRQYLLDPPSRRFNHALGTGAIGLTVVYRHPYSLAMFYQMRCDPPREHRTNSIMALRRSRGVPATRHSPRRHVSMAMGMPTGTCYCHLRFPPLPRNTCFRLATLD